jgi:serine/threonine protein kinase
VLFGFRVSFSFCVFINSIYRYCAGGELFNYIIEKKHLSEEVAAFIMKQLFEAL